MDDGRQPIAIGHLSDSGDLIIHTLNNLDNGSFIMNTQQWNWPVRWLSLVVVPDGQTAELPKTLGCGHQEPVLVAGQEALFPGHGLTETVSGAVSPGPWERQADVRRGARVLPPARDDTHQVRVVVVGTVLVSYRHSPLHKQRDSWEVDLKTWVKMHNAYTFTISNREVKNV